MKFLRYIFILVVVSCGGGGSSSDNQNPINNNPQILSFSISDLYAPVNSTITLTWSSNNTNSCQGSGDWSGAKNVNGSESIQLDTVRTYQFTLTCLNTTSNISVNTSISIVITDETEVGSEIYNVDQESYCKLPNNNSNEYWIENFDNNIINPEIFTYEEGNGFCADENCNNWVQGWGNDEIQYYTSCNEGYSKSCKAELNSTENAFVEDGVLIIQPIYNTTDPFIDPYCGPETCNPTWDYTSARLMSSSKKNITPNSEVTICFKIPDGSGHWPAFWFLPQGFKEFTKSWPDDGEIDQLEHSPIYHSLQEAQSSVHYLLNASHSSTYKVEMLPNHVNFHDKFHSISIKWEYNFLNFYLDTQTTPYFSIANNQGDFINNNYPFNGEFYFILNVASGGNLGGSPDDSRYCNNQNCDNLPDPSIGRFLIDYIEIKSID